MKDVRLEFFGNPMNSLL